MKQPLSPSTRHPRWSCGLILAVAVLGASCGGTVSEPVAENTPADAASGVMRVTGTAPPASNGFPAIVVLEPIGAGDQPAQSSAPRMDQEQQEFIPKLLLVRTNQQVEFLNHDDVLHNVRVKNGDTQASAFNVAIPTGEHYTHVFKTDGFYDVGCDIHPGMSAQIFSSTTPYAVTADDAGRFSIPDVLNGPYKAIAYAGAQTIEKEVSIGPGSSALDLTKP